MSSMHVKYVDFPDDIKDTNQNGNSAPKSASTAPPPENPMPADMEAEKSLLGAIMLANELFAEVVGHLTVGDFYRSAHRTIFRAIQQLASNGFAIDPITLMDEINRAEPESKVSAAYLASLFEGVPRFSDPSHIENYIRLIANASARRRLINTGNEITNLGFDSSITVTEQIVESQRKLAQVEDPNTRISWHQAGNVATEVLEQAQKFACSKRQIFGLATGFNEIDHMMDGLQDGDFIVMGARPGVGKTSLVSAMALEAARSPLNNNPTIASFTLEMTRQQTNTRYLSYLTDIPVRNIRRGLPLAGWSDREHWKKLQEAAGLLDSLNIHLDDQPLTPNQMRLKLRNLIRQQKQLDLIIVDYLQLMTPNIEMGGATQNISAISKELKLIAKEFNKPLISIVSLSRAPETRQNKRPMLSDFRDSGQIESDADVAIGIYRDELYYPETEKKGIAEIDFLKQRNGPIGNVELLFKPETTKFMSKT